MSHINATQSTGSYLLQGLRAPIVATRRMFEDLVQDVRRKFVGRTPSEPLQPAPVQASVVALDTASARSSGQTGLPKYTEDDAARIPPDIARFLDQNLASKADSVSGSKRLAMLEDFVAYCAHTEPATDSDGLVEQLKIAENLARSARFPHQRYSSEAYVTLRNGLNPLLDAEMKEISAVHAFVPALQAAGVRADQFDGCSLSDLMDLCRAGRNASEVAASPDSIATQALNLRSSPAVAATDATQVKVPRYTAPPIWAQNMVGHFDSFARDNADALHTLSAKSVCSKVCHELKSYSTRLDRYASGSVEAFRSSGATEIQKLKGLQDRLLASGQSSELQQALAAAIDAEISTWDRMGDLLNTLTNRHPGIDVGQVSVSELLTIGRTRLPTVSGPADGDRKGHIGVDEVKELIDARSGFAPGLPLAHFLAMKMRYIPLTPATMPDMALSAAVARLQLGEVGSGACGTVWKATVTDTSSHTTITWALKAEDSEFDPPDSAKVIGVTGYTSKHPAGPNFTGRTVAASKVAASLGTTAAPESRPVVFFDPKTQEMVYGAASQFVQGSMLQSSPGKTARYTPDTATATALAALDPADRQAVMDRIGQAMGFGSVELNESTGEWQLKPDVHQRYLQPLNWNDAEIRRTASDGSLWASMTAQADNHAGNYMVETLANGHARLVSIDNDLSLGKKPTHPMAVAGEVNNAISHAAWAQYLKDTTGTVARPATITDAQRKEFVAKGVKGLRSDNKFKIDADYTANLRQIARFTQLVSDLQVQPDGSSAVGIEPDHWARSLGMSGEAYTKASGVPRVISSSAGKALLALTEAQVRSDLGALEPAEQDAAWSRTQALQQMVATGQIHTLEDSDPAWSSDEVGQLMGLDPATLQELARADLAPGVGGTPNGDQHRMAYGLPAALAMEEAMAREAATQRLAANPMGDKAVALFDTAWLNSAVLEAARTAQAISPIKV